MAEHCIYRGGARSKIGPGATTPYSANLYELRLELARQRDCPNGDSRHGYTFIAPLTHDGRLDAPLWLADPEACRLLRFRPDEDDRSGHLAIQAGGRWRFDYGLNAIDEAPGFRFGDEHFALGEYISIHETDGSFHDFKITSVRRI